MDIGSAMRASVSLFLLLAMPQLRSRTLGTWIDQIRNDPTISNAMLQELRSINDDIVQLANQVVEIDEQSHWRLDLIKSRSRAELETLNKGTTALRAYKRGYGMDPTMQCYS